MAGWAEIDWCPQVIISSTRTQCGYFCHYYSWSQSFQSKKLTVFLRDAHISKVLSNDTQSTATHAYTRATSSSTAVQPQKLFCTFLATHKQEVGPHRVKSCCIQLQDIALLSLIQQPKPFMLRWKICFCVVTYLCYFAEDRLMIEHQLCKERTCDSLQNEVPAALPVHCLAQSLNLSLYANHTKRLSPEQYTHICVELVKKIWKMIQELNM